jgi:hypothetical protein
MAASINNPKMKIYMAGGKKFSCHGPTHGQTAGENWHSNMSKGNSEVESQ